MYSFVSITIQVASEGEVLDVPQVKFTLELSYSYKGRKRWGYKLKQSLYNTRE